MKLRRDEHGSITGSTGSGKSFFAKHIFDMYPRAIFYDLKHDPDHTEFRRNYSIAKTPARMVALLKQGKTHVWIMPRSGKDLKEIQKILDGYMKICYRQGNIAVFIDEAANVTNSSTISSYHFQCLSMGRSRGIAVIDVTQKPVHVNNSIYSEASWHALFRLTVESHRDKIAGIVGKETAEKLKTIEKHHFYFVHNEEMENPPKIKLPDPKEAE
jgi:hypothetical protein